MQLPTYATYLSTHPRMYVYLVKLTMENAADECGSVDSTAMQ